MSCSPRVLKVFLSRTAQRIPYMTGGRVMRMLAVILLVVFWFLVGWTSSVCQNLERQISLIGQGRTSDHPTFSMCLCRALGLHDSSRTWSPACAVVLCLPTSMTTDFLRSLYKPFHKL